MHKLRSVSVARLAKGFSRLSSRLKSTEGRPVAPLGSRILTNRDDIFKHNVWDRVQWTEEEENARQRTEENSCVQIPLKEQGKFDTAACEYWDKFYEMHQEKFFKDRKWLFLEFPELLPSVGCRVGNSAFPILNSIKETDAFLYCCDFSPRASQLVKDHPDYNESACHAFVHDVCEEMASVPFPPESLDVILAVFVLSSIHRDRIQGVVNGLVTYLKHGGIFLLRDYGRYDTSQLRFKKGRCLSENFYTRGDGTCVYYFTKEEVHDLFSNAGLEEIQNMDRRLQVNRGKKVVMHRVWLQSKYRKSCPPSPS